MSKALLSHAYDEVIAFLARRPSQEEIAAFRLSDAAEELDQCVQVDQMMVLIRSRAQHNKQGSEGA